MDKNTAIEWMYNLRIGEVVAWTAVIIGICAGICALAIKLYKVFERYKGVKDKKCRAGVKHKKS